MKLQKANSKSAEHSLIATLKQRLGINNIFRQFELITNMTRNLDIKLNIFARFQPIRHLSKEQLLRVIKHVPFLSYLKVKRGELEEEYINIKYENSSKVLLVTGMTKQAIEEMLKHFDNFGSGFHHNKRNNARIIANNGFWVTIETHSQDHAANLKKYIRGKKRINDQNNTSYKVEGRRIRIVILKEDFLSILIDAMTEIKSQLFQKHFQVPNPPAIERRKSQDETVLNAELRRKTIIYRPIIMNAYYPRNEQEEKELSDGFSESNSLSSDILDSNKIKDLIQTSDQGIQSESNAEFAESSLENISDKENQSQCSESKIVNQVEKESPSPERIEAALAVKTQPQKEEAAQLTISQEIHQDVQQSKKEEIQQSQYLQPFQPQTLITNQSKADDPFLSTELFAAPQSLQPASTAIQTQETHLSSIPYSHMRKLLQQFKQMRNTNQLIELPEWIKSESEEQRNRHRFFDSLCRPKIIQKRSTYQ